jgi:hypothetical protein
MVNSELQKRNGQAHYNWAKAHQQELQQLRAIISQLRETILSSTNFQYPSQQRLTAVETTPAGIEIIESKSLSTNEPRPEFEKFNRRNKQQLKLKARFQIPKWLLGISRTIEIY